MLSVQASQTEETLARDKFWANLPDYIKDEWIKGGDTNIFANIPGYVFYPNYPNAPDSSGNYYIRCVCSMLEYNLNISQKYTLY